MDAVIGRPNLMICYAQLIKAVTAPNARLEIIDAENMQTCIAADCGKQLANRLNALACLSADEWGKPGFPPWRAPGATL